MRGFDTAHLAYHLRRLDGDALAGLVADLYAARGYETTREGAHVGATAGNGRLRVWVPRADRQGQRPDVSADVVVAFDGEPRGRRPGDARVVDAAALAEMLVHAVDRPDTRRLCERYLGAPPEALPPPPAVRARRGLETLSGSTAGAFVGVALLVLAVALGAAGWLPAGSVPGADGPAASGAETGSGLDESSVDPEDVRTADATADATRPHASPASAVGRAVAGSGEPPLTDRELPPGVTLRGIVDVTALAGAHHRVARNHSHTVQLDRYPIRAEPNTSHLRRDLTLAAAGDRYLVTTGRFSPRARHLGAVYHDGNDTYGVYWNGDREAFGRTVALPSDHDRAPTPAVGQAAIERYLSTPRSMVLGRTEREGRTVYRVGGSGRPATGEFDDVETYSVAALVDERGFVHELRIEYTVRDGVSTREIRREIVYERVGATTVEPPSWYERRVENATG